MTDPNRRLEHAIRQLGADLEPPPGWEAHVLAAVEPRRRRGWARAWIAIPAVAAIAIALAVVLPPRLPGRSPAPLGLSAELVTGSQQVRGASAIRAVVRGGERHRAIWIYRDGRELVAQCPGHGACQSARRDDALSLVLDAPIGNYQIIALSSAAAVPAAIGAPESDLAAAVAAGATWKMRELDVK
jgi:hypothetical protein